MALDTSSPVLWVGFVAFVLAMLALDLGVFHRRVHEIRVREAAIWSAVWIGLALLFNVGVYFLLGPQRALEFFTGYLVEKSLSVDNIFIFIVLLSYFAVPRELQHRVLFWGVLGALVMRAIFIFLGAALLHQFHWAIYLFGGFLVLTAIRLAAQGEKEEHPERNLIVRAFRKLVPTVDEYHDGHFTIVKDGRRFATPLLVVLVAIEATDIVFAVDSIPAVFAVTENPFIVFTSNIFAVLGLRSLYFVLEGGLKKLRYLKPALALVLGFVGVKMLFGGIYKIPTLVSLAVIAGLLGGAVALSLWRGRRSAGDAGTPPPPKTPLTVHKTSARPLLFAVAAAVFSFGGTLWFSHVGLDTLDEETAEIVQNTTPSIQRLAAAGAELQRVGVYAHEYVHDAYMGRATSREPIMQSRARLAAELAAYADLPSAPGEMHLATELGSIVPTLDRSLDTALAYADAGNVDAARGLLRNEVHAHLDSGATLLHRALEWNAAYASERAAEIDAIRHRAVVTAMILGLLSTLIVAMATLLAVRNMEQQHRLLEERDILQVARATELEAFASRVAHDLRNPIGAMSLRLEMIQRGKLEDKTRTAVDSLGRQVGRLNGMVGALLEFACAGARPTPNARAAVHDVIAGVVADERHAAEALGTEIRVEESAVAFAFCTPGALTSVLSNLVQNAVKYTAGAARAVRAVTVRSMLRGARVRIEVIDTGPGLPQGAERLIFEPYVRLSGTQQPGLGLGLATVRRIVEAYGGCTGVDPVDEGSRFWVELPAAAGNSEAKPVDDRLPTPA